MRIPESHQIMAKIIVVDLILHRDQIISEVREWEEVEPWMMRDPALDYRRAKTQRDLVPVDDGRRGIGIEIEYGDCVVRVHPLHGHTHGMRVVDYCALDIQA